MGRIVNRGGLAVAALLVLAGCGEEPNPTVRRDSLGIAIVESSAPVWDARPAWSVDTVPLLSLGREEASAAEEFHQIVSTVRQPNGDIVVVDGGTRELRTFDATGRHRWTFGRIGDGPGDFRQILTLLRWPGDSLAVFDYRLGRLTVVSSTGEFGRVVALLGNHPATYGLQLMGDSLLVAKVIMLGALQGTGLTRLPAAIITVPLAGQGADTIAIVPAEETVLSGDGSSGGVLYGKDASVATAGNAIVLGTAERLEIAWVDRSGRVTQSARVPSFDLSIPPEERERERAFLLGANRSPTAQARLDAMPVLTERPAYRALLGDPTGAVWAEPHVPFSDRETNRPWQVFAPTGEWLGPFLMPGRFKPFDIGPDYLLGVQADSLGIERVRLFRLRRS